MITIQEEINELYAKLGDREDFNIFDKLSLKNKELIHSKFIESVLNYNLEFLSLFLDMLNEKCSNSEIQEFRDYEIDTEHNLSSGKKKYGRADIWIGEKSKQLTPRKRIIIENKIYANEQWRQLDRYHKYLIDNKNEREGWLFYLTLEGKYASKNSATHKDYYTISYHDIRSWLVKCSESDKAGSQIKIAITQYLNNLYSITVKYHHIKLLIDNNKEYIPTTINKVGLSKKEFTTALEYEFWNKIDSKIKNEFIEFRRYSYDKVYKRNVKEKIDREYGIMYKVNQSDILISVNDKKGRLLISSGEFDKENNSWKSKKDLTQPVNALNFKSILEVDIMIKELLKTIKSLDID